MKWSWKPGEIAGRGIYVHWTFIPLIAWILISHVVEANSLAMTFEGVGLMKALAESGFGVPGVHDLKEKMNAKGVTVRLRMPRFRGL